MRKTDRSPLDRNRIRFNRHARRQERRGNATGAYVYTIRQAARASIRATLYGCVQVPSPLGAIEGYSPLTAGAEWIDTQEVN